MKKINIVWFKKDLRLSDHAPLHHAIEAGLPVLLLFCFEPTMQQSSTWNTRHWWFIYHALEDMKSILCTYNHKIHLFHTELLPLLKKITHDFEIDSIFSHQETGIGISYERDIKYREFCKTKQIQCLEYQNNGVVRALKDKQGWGKMWENYMMQSLIKVDLPQLKTIELPAKYTAAYGLESLPLPKGVIEPTNTFKPDLTTQQPSESYAWALLASFVKNRSRNYKEHQAKAEASRQSCSRLAPYLAYGNLSIRQVYQYVQAHLQTNHSRNLHHFLKCLYWRCHFVQRFEMEDSMEFSNLNLAYNGIRVRWNQRHYKAWTQGKTGYPFVDACMRCVIQTGYLNFKMRVLLVSFLTHHLWLDWRKGATFLAQQFLDFEPGIHYCQFQIQAGVMGIHAIQVAKPIKASKMQDPQAVFIKKWIPAMREVPAGLCHEPWKMSEMEQQMYHCQLGKDYPTPIIDVVRTHQRATKELNRIKNTERAKIEVARISEKQLKNPKLKWKH